MEKYLISFKNTEGSVQIACSQTILDAIWKAGAAVDAPCAGNGRCYKCKFRLIEGKVDVPHFVAPDIYLACKARPLADCVIELNSIDLEIDHTLNFADIELLNVSKTLPYIQKHLLLLNELEIKGSQQHLVAFINQRFPGIIPDNNNISSLLTNEILIETEKITLTIRNKEELIDVEPGDTKKFNFGLAVDLGTTTIDVFLVDLNTSKILVHKSRYNSQRRYGEDIISRIIYCEKNKDTEQVQKAVVETINKIIDSILADYSINCSNIYSVVLAGNTTMSYLITNQDPAPIRRSDDVEKFKSLEAFQAKQVGLKVSTNTKVLVLPAISSFVGGDISAGILSTQLFKADKLTLLVDIGTNGELVLGNKEWMLCCSCSAGPAFEGSSVSCGTRFIPGAINKLSIDPENYSLDYKTHMNQPPIGICGTALIDLVAQMLDAKIIDRQGKINQSLNSERIRKKGNVYEYVVVFSDNDIIKTDLSIDENDIHNLIRAKAAIFAGIIMLLRSVDLTLGDLEQVIVAGTFGKHINFENAIKIGLLPDIEVNKFKFSGNTSLLGAYQLLSNENLESIVNSIVKDVTYIDLSTNAAYMDLYVSGLFLPHTDLSLFRQK